MGLFKRSRSRSFDLLSAFNWYTPGWGGLLGFMGMFLLGWIFASIMGIIIMSMQAKGFLPDGFFLTYGATLIVYPLMFLPAMLFASASSARNRMFVNGYRIDCSNFSPVGGWKLAIAASMAMLAGAIVTDPLTAAMPEMDEKTRMALEAITNGPLWVSILAASIFAPFFEEWLCRGILLRSLLRKCHPAIAIPLSAAFFGLIHGNIWQGSIAFLIGCLMGWVYYRTGSLRLTMLMHCVNNTFSIILSRIPGISDYDTVKEMLDNDWKYAVVVASGIIVLAFCIFIISKVKALTPQGSNEEITPEMPLGAE